MVTWLCCGAANLVAVRGYRVYHITTLQIAINVEKKSKVVVVIFLVILYIRF